jgi:hypothetical protein
MYEYLNAYSQFLFPRGFFGTKWTHGPLSYTYCYLFLCFIQESFAKGHEMELKIIFPKLIYGRQKTVSSTLTFEM